MRSIFTTLMSSVILIGATGVAAQDTTRNVQDVVSQSQKAAKVFHEIMGAPDKAIPKDVLDDAECVAVFPEVVQAAFGIGGGSRTQWGSRWLVGVATHTHTHSSITRTLS